MYLVPRRSLLRLVLAAALATACGKDSSGSHAAGGAGPPATEPPPSSPETPQQPPPATPPEVPPTDPGPVTKNGWTFYGTDRGVGADVRDVSADEAGNVYVAGGDALYVKRRADTRFLRFDSTNAGLTVNCNDPTQGEVPTKPFYQCPVISVAGASSGRAVIGFEGFQTETSDSPQWDWALLGNGGADVVAFDGVTGELSRVRHVDVGSPPYVICAVAGSESRGGTCSDPGNYWWTHGRHLVHKIERIVVNHDVGSDLYGDAWMCGRHGTFSVLLANATRRGYTDHTAGVDPKYQDEKDVWEHLHPAFQRAGHPDDFINGECTALSLDPRNGTPWGSNRYRTVYVQGYPDLRSEDWWMGPSGSSNWYDLWPDPSKEDITTAYDDVSTMSHCADGSLWVGSLQRGLARIGTDGSVSRLSLPDPALGNSVAAVACDPLDSSLWIGLGKGGVLRLKNGAFQRVDTTGVPEFANHPVQSIQIDSWAATRIVYFAFQQTAPGGTASPGGVAAYDGP